MTLRQVWVRIQALPAEAPVWNALRADQERRAEQQQLADIDNVLDMFKPKRSERGGGST